MNAQGDIIKEAQHPRLQQDAEKGVGERLLAFFGKTCAAFAALSCCV